MKTTVVQSFRTCNVPNYINACLSSVEAWSKREGHQYTFVDDTLFSHVPLWYREKAAGSICAVTDVARLIEARTLLNSGTDLVIWIDADVIIHRPEAFQVMAADTQYCREVWLHRRNDGSIIPEYKVNNSVCTFVRTSLEHLDQYIDECLQRASGLERFATGCEVGTEYLTQHCRDKATIRNVGMMSPILAQAILRRQQRIVDSYMEWHGSPVFAYNLCNALRHTLGYGPEVFDFLALEVINSLHTT